MIRNELRIGSWIYDTVTKREEQVWSIHPDERSRLMVNATEARLVHPIKITKEWLIRLGFVRVSSIPYRWYLDDWLAYDLDDNCICIRGNWDFGKREYVHEIQNLCLAIKGEEIAIKEIESND